jgi:hypothetical protein
VRPGDGDIPAYLVAHDAACRACGYSLRAVPGPVCPECGAALRWDTIEPLPRPLAATRAFAGAQAAVLSGAALSLFLLTFRLERVAAAPRPALVLGGLALPCLIIVAAGAWLAARPRVLRLRPRSQARLFWGALALVLLEALAAMHAGLL